MLPRIKKVELGKIHINDDVISSDFFLHANGVEQLDKTNRISKKEFERMLLHEPEIAIFGTGFKGKLNVSEDVLDAAKKSSVDVHVLKTPDALKKFQEFARKGRKVVAHIHVGE
ncbi:MAG: MTH938/NDUFAF3 family protein [Candidatus Aenigmatarchaeota archaeon]